MGGMLLDSGLALLVEAWLTSQASVKCRQPCQPSCCRGVGWVFWHLADPPSQGLAGAPAEICLYAALAPKLLQGVRPGSKATSKGITDAASTCLFGAVQAALAAKLLEEEWPDQAETAAARLAEREAATPVPERVWALRNVASTLVRPGAGYCYCVRAPKIERLKPSAADSGHASLPGAWGPLKGCEPSKGIASAS